MPKQSVTYPKPLGKLLGAKRMAETIEDNLEYLGTLQEAEGEQLADEMRESETLKMAIGLDWTNWQACGDDPRDQLDWLLRFAASYIVVGYYLNPPKPGPYMN